MSEIVLNISGTNRNIDKEILQKNIDFTIEKYLRPFQALNTNYEILTL